MNSRDSFPDDVPVADAVEQNRLVTESADDDGTDAVQQVSAGDGPVPLESNESDWQEQRQVVDDPDQDDIR
ncbi:hypothetical protein [Mycobacterium sp. shizuoka-1]|uniref:hypothetical protein n=1 Tax=Mycobacterium sp. shizuoka-1 TaxID=2039281 RepID=UPI000C05F426|nr:hypothetical protein [Mycobacterium sp. shizuoka-1]GAY18960.1 hypothetical protein MSZK_56860 [Mycobacterium sp. shizuoka-1]